MKKRILFAAGWIAVLALAGCQNNMNNQEKENLRQQNVQVEQQTIQTENTGTASAEILTIEELTASVNAYVEKVEAISVSEKEAKTMEEFFEWKKEEESLERELGRYEDDLEFRYRKGSLTRDEYRTLERDAESLEEQLDRAENKLERAFGMDD